ncbi:MAG: DNA translocase FtsK 4TM domain-containing protein [Pikeienuella sp.]
MASVSDEGDAAALGDAPSPGGTAIGRRLTELWGLVFLALALALGLALASYAATDPSFFSAPGAPPNNWLGRIGAVIADPLMRMIGLGAWFFVVFPLVWGTRMLLHHGEERIWARLLLVPIAVILGALFAATHAPAAGWPLSVGLGGHLGDNGALALLHALPVSGAVAIRPISLLLGLLTLFIWAAALGVTAAEIAAFRRWVFGSFARLAGRGRGASRKPAKPRQPMPEPTRPPDQDPAPSSRGRLWPFGKSEERDFDLDAVVIPPPGADIDPRESSLLRPPADGSTEVRRDPIPPVGAASAQPATEPKVAAAENALSAAIQALSAATPQLPETADPLGLDREAAMRAIMGDDAGAGPPPSPDYPEGAAARAPEATPQRPASRAESADRQFEAPSRPPPPQTGATFRTDMAGGAKDEDEDDDDETLRPAPPGAPPLSPAPEPYDRPPFSLLQEPRRQPTSPLSQLTLEENARQLETVLADYGVRGEIVAVKPGPVVTLYELEPAPGLKAARVIGLADDIARSMSALSARVSTVPGRSVIGIELPNSRRQTVYLREVFEREDYEQSRHPLALALGKTIEGEPCVANLAKMPHLLIAGTTGSGKSVAINTMILSILYRLSPEQCRLIMIDPKMLELSVYDGIPHLLAPVVTDPKKALVALKWVVGEMEERYRKMSKTGVRNIDGYNARVREALAKGEVFERTVQTGFDDATGEPVYETETIEPEAMPFVVVIVDEMADLMMVAGKEIEACIQRLAQMARASGIHLIMATQRPSVDVITGTIKANFPTRISFQVTSKIDSRTILGEQGAEQLLGQGDMLYMAPGGRVRRVHGPFVSDDEVEEVVRHLKSLGAPDYVYDVIDGGDEETQALVEEKLGLATGGDSEEALYDKAVAIVARDRKCSTSYIQRKLQIGYNKAARLVEQMEDQGVVSPANAVGKREILIEER